MAGRDVTGSSIRSMTGFGSAAGADGGHEIRVEVRGVNHRHLLWKGGLPPFLQSLEEDVDALIRRHVTRGMLTVSIVHESRESRPRVRFDSRLARAYLTELELFARKLGLRERPGLDFVLGLPGVVEAGATDPSAEELRALLLRVLEEALEDFVASREREGRAILRDIEDRVGELASWIETIDDRWPHVVEEYRTRLERRVREFLAERLESFDDVDVLREVAIFAERADVAEETARFRAHVDEMHRLLAAGGGVGRALGFLTQEMLREANTIGSKSSDADLAHRVVAMKTALDRIKEQAQNLE